MVEVSGKGAVVNVSDECEQAQRTLHLVRAWELVAQCGTEMDREQYLPALKDAVQDVCDAQPPLRVKIVAEVVNVSPQTVRRWVKEGILEVATITPRITITAQSMLEVVSIVDELRRVGQHTDLTSSVWFRLQDNDTVTKTEFARSVEQMRGRKGLRVR